MPDVPADLALRLLLAGVRSSGVVLEWLATYAVHSTLIIGAGLLLASGAMGRRLGLGHSSGFWLAVLLGGVVSSTLQTTGLLDPVSGTVRFASGSSTRAAVAVAVAHASGPSPVAAGPGAARAVPVRAAGPPPSGGMLWRDVKSPATGVRMMRVQVTPVWPLAVVSAWALLAMAGMAWLVARHRSFLRSLGARRDATYSLPGNALREIVRRIGIAQPVRLTVSRRLTSPVALGRGEICLPERALAELDPIQQESILAHELAHLVRRDPLRLLAARLVEVVLFFQPLNRVARRRMQDAAEFASDAWALGAVNRPVSLARCLARVAEWTVGGSRVMVPAMVERPGSVLVRRVARLTSGRDLAYTGPRRLVPLLAVGALVVVAAFAPRAAVGASTGAAAAIDTREMRTVLFRPAGALGRTPGQASGAGQVFVRVLER